jgi:hypothetical protein
MGSQDERGEITPMPVSPELAREEGSRFIGINEEFRRLIETARMNPSEHSLEAICELRDVASESSTPMQESLFFSTSDDQELVRTAVGAVLHEVEQNWKLATKIDPSDPSLEGFPEGLRDMLTAKLMGEEEEEDADLLTNTVEVDMNDLKMLSELPSEALAYLVCITHRVSVEDLYRGLMTSNEVMEHEIEEIERERRRERVVTVSLATAGAFIASSLAYALAQRRKK